MYMTQVVGFILSVSNNSSLYCLKLMVTLAMLIAYARAWGSISRHTMKNYIN